MKFRKRYEEFSINENLEVEERKASTEKILTIVLRIIHIALWVLPFVLTAVTDKFLIISVMGAFIYSFGISNFMKKKKATGFVLMGYGVFVFIFNMIYCTQDSMTVLFLIGILLCNTLGDKSKKSLKDNPNIKYYRKPSDSGDAADEPKNEPDKFYYNTSARNGMFINDDKSEFDENRSYSVDSISGKISDLQKQEMEEMVQNGGKMVSESYFSDSNFKKSLFKLKAGIIIYVIAFIAALGFGFAFSRVGLFMGLILISLSVLLLLNKQPEGYNQNSSKTLGIALGIPGVLMAILNIAFKDDSATLVMVFALFFAIFLACMHQSNENKKYMLEHATELIQAECVKVEKETRQTEDRTIIEFYPVFEIEYKGMRKRLRARSAYTKPPEVGFKRIIYVNPDNLDEWYDPQNMSSYGI